MKTLIKQHPLTTTVPYIIKTSGITQYEFDSLGPRGLITKGIEISPLEHHPNTYNFGFGDLGPDGEIDDTSESNNGDLLRVFATVIKIMRDFMDLRPEAVLFFRGSTTQRTKIYQLIIARYYDIFSREFEITAIQTIKKQHYEVEFVPRGREKYLAFLVRKK